MNPFRRKLSTRAALASHLVLAWDLLPSLLPGEPCKLIKVGKRIVSLHEGSGIGLHYKGFTNFLNGFGFAYSSLVFLADKGHQGGDIEVPLLQGVHVGIGFRRIPIQKMASLLLGRSLARRTCTIPSVSFMDSELTKGKGTSCPWQSVSAFQKWLFKWLIGPCV